MSPLGQAPGGLLALAALFLFLLCSFLNAGEISLRHLTVEKARDLVEEKHKTAPKVLRLVENKRRLTRHIHVSRIAFQTAGAVFLTVAFADFDWPWWAVLLSGWLGASLLLVLVVTVVPNRVAAANPAMVVMVLSPLLGLVNTISTGTVGCFTKCFGPLARRLAHRQAEHVPSEYETKEEITTDLRELIDKVEAEPMEEQDRDLLESVFEIGQTLVREVMVPRPHMVTVDADVLLDEAIGLFIRSGYSRMPVVGVNTDDIRGVLYLKDALLRLHTEKPTKPVMASQAMRQARFVPEMIVADDLLRQMQTESYHMALVVDEYGGIAGLVTLEDLLEELVGEMHDEHDHATLTITELEPGVWQVPTRSPARDLGDLFDIEIADDDVDSVGGLMSKALGKVPLPGAEAEVYGIYLLAGEAQGRRRQVATVTARLADSDAVEDV